MIKLNYLVAEGPRTLVVASKYACSQDIYTVTKAAICWVSSSLLVDKVLTLDVATSVQ
jgi:hypothetical protein